MLLPDLSGLRSNLLGSLMLGLIVGIKHIPRGPVNFLVPEFVRTVEQAVALYETARENLGHATRDGALVGFVRASGDLEVAYMVLNKAMRIGEALVASEQTILPKDRLPSEAARRKLRLMRNAIEHEVEPIKEGRGGEGEALALEVRASFARIADESGMHVAEHHELAGWVRALHGLATDLVAEPETWFRGSVDGARSAG